MDSFINPKCKICNLYLNKDGIFIPSLDPYYLLMADNKDGGEYESYAFHTALLFLLIETSNEKEEILKQDFIHIECIPEELKKYIPTQKDINDYVFTGKPGEDLLHKMTLEKAKKSRIPGDPKI